MKIEFTREEYKCLVDMLYIAEWVQNAHSVEDDPRAEPYEKLEQKIYSYAKDMGLEDLIEFDSEHEKYYPTRKFEETGYHRECIDEYDNKTFWEDLISRLANRDLIRQMGGVENLSKLSFEERIQKTLTLEKKYSSEFEKRGLDGVNIVYNSE